MSPLLFSPGHFVVVVGYNKKEKVIYYKNPSYKEGEEKCESIVVNVAAKHTQYIHSCGGFLRMSISSVLSFTL